MVLILGFSWYYFLVGLVTLIIAYLIGNRFNAQRIDSNRNIILEERIVELERELKKTKAEVEKSKSKEETPDEASNLPISASDKISKNVSKPNELKRKSKFSLLPKDNLQIIEGIGPKMESVLKENDINNWQSLAKESKESLRSILEKYGNKYKIIDAESWPEQAKLASDELWSQLIKLQKKMGLVNIIGSVESPAKIEKVMVKLGILKEYKLDDLKAIEGVGPKIAELLTNAGIDNWNKLANSDEATIQKVLDKAGKRFQLADPSTWPMQAALADQGRFDELSDYQDSL